MKPTTRLIAQNNEDLAKALEAMTQPEIDRFVRTILPLVDSRLLIHPLLGTCLRKFEADVLTDKSAAARLRVIAKELDQEYFQLQEDGVSEQEWSEKFHQSRLATALAMIADGASESNISEIVYEMGHAHDPPDQFFDRIADTL